MKTITVEEALLLIKRTLPEKDSHNFTTTAVRAGIKLKDENIEPYTAKGWNSARFVLLEAFKALQ